MTNVEDYATKFSLLPYFKMYESKYLQKEYFLCHLFPVMKYEKPVLYPRYLKPIFWQKKS